MTVFHPSTFKYLKPTDQQLKAMETVREASLQYALVLDSFLPDGPDKTYVLRTLRTAAMWANIAITREADGRPAIDHKAVHPILG